MLSEICLKKNCSRFFYRMSGYYLVKKGDTVPQSYLVHFCTMCPNVSYLTGTGFEVRCRNRISGWVFVFFLSFFRQLVSQTLKIWLSGFISLLIHRSRSSNNSIPCYHTEWWITLVWIKSCNGVCLEGLRAVAKICHSRWLQCQQCDTHERLVAWGSWLVLSKKAKSLNRAAKTHSLTAQQQFQGGHWMLCSSGFHYTFN
jgi:hypothetical protein